MNWILLAAILSQVPTHVGKVDFTKQCSFLFKRKDASYTKNGSIFLKKAEVWNTAIDVDGKPASGAVVGQLPEPPKNIIPINANTLLVPRFDSRDCKPLSNGHDLCRNIILEPLVVRIGVR